MKDGKNIYSVGDGRSRVRENVRNEMESGDLERDGRLVDDQRLEDHVSDLVWEDTTVSSKTGRDEQRN